MVELEESNCRGRNAVVQGRTFNTHGFCPSAGLMLRLPPMGVDAINQKAASLAAPFGQLISKRMNPSRGEAAIATSFKRMSPPFLMSMNSVLLTESTPG